MLVTSLPDDRDSDIVYQIQRDSRAPAGTQIINKTDKLWFTAELNLTGPSRRPTEEWDKDLQAGKVQGGWGHQSY